jgi:hypothetical protein
MKNVMYYYNGVQSEQELHEDEVVDNLSQGQVMERAGEYWRITDVKTAIVASEPARIDVVEIFLAGPEKRGGAKRYSQRHPQNNPRKIF